jgi:hypothetical protein
MADVDYRAVLADLRARREKLDQAIGVIESLLGEGALAAGLVATNGIGAPASTEIAPDTFFGLPTVPAAKKYLGMVRKAQNADQIAEALRKGGLIVKEDTVTSLLQRATKDNADPELRRVGRGLYGLSAWYAR